MVERWFVVNCVSAKSLVSERGREAVGDNRRVVTGQFNVTLKRVSNECGFRHEQILAPIWSEQASGFEICPYLRPLCAADCSQYSDSLGVDHDGIEFQVGDLRQVIGHVA